MTGLHRPITRLTAELDYRTRQPFVVRLEAGGHLIRIRPRGTRTWLTVTVLQLYQLAAETRAREVRAERLRLRSERKALRLEQRRAERLRYS